MKWEKNQGKIVTKKLTQRHKGREDHKGRGKKGVFVRNLSVDFTMG
jgi:hypothetical protein